MVECGIGPLREAWRGILNPSCLLDVHSPDLLKRILVPFVEQPSCPHKNLYRLESDSLRQPKGFEAYTTCLQEPKNQRNQSKFSKTCRALGDLYQKDQPIIFNEYVQIWSVKNLHLLHWFPCPLDQALSRQQRFARLLRSIIIIQTQEHNALFAETCSLVVPVGSTSLASFIASDVAIS